MENKKFEVFGMNTIKNGQLKNITDLLEIDNVTVVTHLAGAAHGSLFKAEEFILNNFSCKINIYYNYSKVKKIQLHDNEFL